MWNRPKATYIYTVSLTLCFKFLWKIFKRHSITHATGTNIDIYTQACVHDGMEMRQNLFVDLLAYERNEYRRFFPTDIKHYLRRITEMPIK